MLSRTAGGARSLLGLLDRGVIEVRFSLQAELESIERLMRRYASVPMSLAGLKLVWLGFPVPRGRGTRNPIVL